LVRRQLTGEEDAQRRESHIQTKAPTTEIRNRELPPGSTK
jgi:hypothetical protein